MMEQFKELSLSDTYSVKVGNNGTIIGDRGEMKPNTNSKKGYSRVHTKIGHYAVHRLVALAWLPNPQNKPQINHKDGNKNNNSVDNLEWVTNQENRIHAVNNDLSSAVLSTDQVKTIRDMYSTGLYTYEQIAELFGVCYSTVGYIIRGNTWKSL